MIDDPKRSEFLLWDTRLTLDNMDPRTWDEDVLYDLHFWLCWATSGGFQRTKTWAKDFENRVRQALARGESLWFVLRSKWECEGETWFVAGLALIEDGELVGTAYTWGKHATKATEVTYHEEVSRVPDADLIRHKELGPLPVPVAEFVDVYEGRCLAKYEMENFFKYRGLTRSFRVPKENKLYEFLCELVGPHEGGRTADDT